MTDHSELLKEARELGNFRDETGTVRDYKRATALYKLADIVEAYDKQPSFDENFKALKEQLDDLDRRLGQSTVNDELLAACRTCAEVIEYTITLEMSPFPFNDQDRSKLSAACHLAKRAVENADKLKGGA